MVSPDERPTLDQIEQDQYALLSWIVTTDDFRRWARHIHKTQHITLETVVDFHTWLNTPGNYDENRSEPFYDGSAALSVTAPMGPLFRLKIKAFRGIQLRSMRGEMQRHRFREIDLTNVTKADTPFVLYCYQQRDHTYCWYAETFTTAQPEITPMIDPSQSPEPLIVGTQYCKSWILTQEQLKKLIVMQVDYANLDQVTDFDLSVPLMHAVQTAASSEAFLIGYLTGKGFLINHTFSHDLNTTVVADVLGMDASDIQLRIVDLHHVSLADTPLILYLYRKTDQCDGNNRYKRGAYQWFGVKIEGTPEVLTKIASLSTIDAINVHPTKVMPTEQAIQQKSAQLQQDKSLLIPISGEIDVSTWFTINEAAATAIEQLQRKTIKQLMELDYRALLLDAIEPIIAKAVNDVLHDAFFRSPETRFKFLYDAVNVITIDHLDVDPHDASTLLFYLGLEGGKDPKVPLWAFSLSKMVTAMLALNQQYSPTERLRHADHLRQIRDSLQSVANQINECLAYKHSD